MLSPKAALRNHYKHIRTSITEQSRAAQQQILSRHMITNHLFLQANTIGAYQPMQAEFDPADIIKQAKQKTIVYPIITDKENSLMVYRDHHQQTYDHIDLILVPCVAFDTQCYRLGMGGGYFDRFIAKLEQDNKPYLLGIGFTEQLADRLPIDSWDQPLDNILTADGFIHPIAD